MSLHLEIEHERVTELCRRNPIQRLAFFGSVLRDDFGPRSDVDVLVEFTPVAQVTLLDMVRMQDELSAIIGRRVDLRTKGFLGRYFRDEVVAAAEVELVAQRRRGAPARMQGAARLAVTSVADRDGR